PRPDRDPTETRPRPDRAPTEARPRPDRGPTEARPRPDRDPTEAQPRPDRGPTGLPNQASNQAPSRSHSADIRACDNVGGTRLRRAARRPWNERERHAARYRAAA
ncbi:polyphosphate kinase, partial [Burkholderia pseudomallei]